MLASVDVFCNPAHICGNDCGKKTPMGRAVERLKVLQVERFSKKPGLYNDGAGLCLRVTSPTARPWVLRYMLNGMAREMGLGSYPEISLAEARVAATEA